jgi:hypothetical protein
VLPGGQVLVTGGRDEAPNPFVCDSELYDPITGLWSRAGALDSGRTDHTATLLSNGDVLVAGGKPAAVAFTDKAEVYDHSAKNWHTTGALSFSRAGHLGTLLANGKVLVAGGFNASFDFISSSEIFDPTNRAWQLSGAMQTLRQSATATLLHNGKVLAAGGFGNNSFLSSAELFDPSSGAWNFTGSMSDQRWEAAAVLLPNGRVLVAGGANNVSSLAPTRTAEIYDQATGNWTPTGPMSHERREFTLTLLPSGKVMAAGGSDTNGPLASVELYDLGTGLWTPAESLQTARASHTATLLPNGTVLVAGGVGVTPIQTTTPVDPVLDSAEIYDPSTGTWTPTGSIGQPRQTHTATLLTNGKVLIAGGVSFFGSVFPTSAEVYDPGTGEWLPTLPLASGRTDHITALLPDGKVLIAGGFNTSDTGPSTELFDPASAVAVPPVLSLTRLSGQSFHITFRNTPGLGFTVLTATNIALPLDQWTSSGTASEISLGHYQFTDDSALPLRFYRVRSQ